jgi:hypothetical protein
VQSWSYCEEESSLPGLSHHYDFFYVVFSLLVEDVTMKVISFSQQGPRAICILSANGVIHFISLIPLVAR